MQLSPQHHARAIVLRILGTLCMALMALLIKLATTRGVPLMEVIFFRSAFAFVPLGIHIACTADFDVLKTRRPVGHIARALIGLSGMAATFAALQHLPLSKATAIQFTTPVLMAALSATVLRERLSKPARWALASGFAGVLIILRPSPESFSGVGVLLGFLGAIGGAATMIAIRQIGQTERGSAIVFYFTLAGTLAGLVGSMFAWVTPDMATLALLVGCGLAGGTAQLALTQSLRLAPVGIVSPFDYTQLLWTTGLGFLIWNELPKTSTLLGAAVIACSSGYLLHHEISDRPAASRQPNTSVVRLTLDRRKIPLPSESVRGGGAVPGSVSIAAKAT